MFGRFYHVCDIKKKPKKIINRYEKKTLSMNSKLMLDIF